MERGAGGAVGPDPTFKQVADNYLAFRKVYKA
jgi:hypothetical protein